MQQFWYSIKKLQFLLANKMCVVNTEVFRTILDICLRVEGVDFIDVPDDDIALTFLINLCYKGPLYKHTNMFVDHMHQPWRTLAAIINKCLSRKNASNDKLRKSRIGILWGMFYRENVDYPELIWEDLAYQIGHRKENRSRRENMPYPRFTKIIINHFFKQHKSLLNYNYQHYQTIKDDGIVSRLKFVRIGKDYQEYGLPIPETMLTEEIKQSESYQITESELEPAKKRTTSKRRVKKSITISAKDNIIPDADVSLKLGKSISLTEAEEAEAARKVHATHAIISVLYLTLKEQEAANTMKALKESRKTSRRQPSTRGSHEGTGRKPGVPDESTVVSATSSANDEDAETESDTDEIYKYKIHVHKDVDVEMTEPKTVKHEKKEKEEMTDAAKPDVEKTTKEEGDAEKVVGTSFPVKEATEFPLPSSSFVPISVILETINLPPIPKILTETLVFIAVSSPQVTPIILRVENLEKDVFELKKIDISDEAFVTLKTHVLTVVDNYLESKVGDVFQKELQKHTTDLIQKYSLMQVPESSKIKTPTINLE
ncbi:hypothetical protein Tco_0649948 [Tanacetum coccineum]